MKIKLNTADIDPEEVSGLRAVGIKANEDDIELYFTSPNYPNSIQSAKSVNGIDFAHSESSLIILNENKKQVADNKIFGLKISKLPTGFMISFQTRTKSQRKSFLATSRFRGTWEVLYKAPAGLTTGLAVDDYMFDNKNLVIFGGKSLKLGLSKNFTNWTFINIETAGKGDVSVDYVVKTSQGIFVIYSNPSPNGPEVKALLLDSENPERVIWETVSSLWEGSDSWLNKSATCIGSIFFRGKLMGYWDVPGLGIFLVAYPLFEKEPSHEHHHYKLGKHPENPILSPNPENEWESEATFNPAAFSADGKVYLVYRAVGRDYVSVLGYAESTDGIHFGARLPFPIFKASGVPIIKTRYYTTLAEDLNQLAHGNKYSSGGGSGGTEDPRITKIGDRIYMIYVSYNGYEGPRLAMTSILYDNFIKKRFLWEKPVIISPPGVIDKSGCILPEKINGKYVIFHRIFPNILIDFVDNLEFDGTTHLKGEYKISPRPTMWDSRKVGTGAPPIKTDKGWLMIYYGVTDADDSKYKIGAMLLDIKDPTKVLHRTNQPLVEPTEYYENDLAKFGIVYPCGAVVVNGNLMVYYGGSDSVTCVATANLNKFLKELEKDKGKLEVIKIHD